MTFGIGDFVKLGELSWQVYKALATAPDVFKALVMETSSMHTVLQLVKESLEQQALPQSLERGLLGISLTCEAVLNDAQKLVEKYKSLGTTTSRRAIDRAGLAIEDVADLRNRMISATSLLTAFQTSLYGSATLLNTATELAENLEYRRSHARIIETLECLRKDIRAGNHEGSILSSLAIEDVGSDRREIWKEVVTELEDAGLDPEVICDERNLITRWFEETISSGGFDEDLIADSSSERTVSVIESAHSGRRLSWTSENSLSLLVPAPSGGETHVASSLFPDEYPYPRPRQPSSIATIKPTLARKPVAHILDNNDIRGELAKLNDLVSSAANIQLSPWTVLSASPQPGDAAIDAIIEEDLRNAVTRESNIRNQKCKSERRVLPLPWGWVFDDFLGLYRNNITSDTANNLPLLDLWSFAVISYELVPRCIQHIRRNFKILNSILQRPSDSIQAAVIGEASWAIQILARAVTKFEILLETSHSPDHIYSEIMLLKEFGGNNELLQSVPISDLISAQNVYSVLMQQILSSLHAFSLIFGPKARHMGYSSGKDHMKSLWQERQMVKRMARLEYLLDDADYWRPVELGLRSIWSRYNENSLLFMNKSAEIASIWSQFYKTKRGAAGDKISIQIDSAVSTVGEQLQKSYFSLNRIGTMITTPLVPLDTVRFIVRVLVDGILLFQTREDERFSQLSRFSWNSTCDILATNCQYIDFEIWDVDSARGNKRRNMAQAVGRIPFKFPISDVAQFGGEDLNKDIHTTKKVEMMSAHNGRPWGILKVSFSWEGRYTIASNLIAANGFSVEMSTSKLLNHAFAYRNNTRVPPKARLIKR